MLILLPPSEGKTPATTGEAVDVDGLQFPELTESRRQVLEVLAKVSAHEDALAALGVGPSLAGDVERNTRLSTEPAAPAHSVYSGVLYDALGYESLTAAQRRHADASVIIFSGLWGAIGPADVIPAYRLSMGVSLPSLGRLARFWKPALTPVLERRSAEELIVDCRSGTYAAAWAGPPGRTVTVNVFRERDGKRSVVSHMAKHTRGQLARLLLQRRGSGPATPEQLLTAARTEWEAELEPATAKKPHALNIVLRD